MFPVIARPKVDATRAMDALRRVVHALHASHGMAQGGYGVTAAQLFVLRQIGSSPGLSLSAIAARTRSAPSSVSEVVSRLIAAGLVDRRISREDARRAELRLTTQGRDIAQKAFVTVQERLVAGFESLPTEVADDVVAALEQWLHAAGLGDSTPGMFFETGR